MRYNKIQYLTKRQSYFVYPA